jgi:hypothetical protein
VRLFVLAINAVFPDVLFQTWIVHLLCCSL